MLFISLQVILVFGLLGACRADEMVHMTTSHVKKIDSPEPMFLVSIPEENKTNVNRSFTITNRAYFELVERYISLRSTEMQAGRFFVIYQDGRCIKQYIDKNKITSAAKEIAKFLD